MTGLPKFGDLDDEPTDYHGCIACGRKTGGHAWLCPYRGLNGVPSMPAPVEASRGKDT